MARTILNRLSDRKARTAPIGMHADGGGLYLRVAVGSGGLLNRYWIFRYSDRTTRKDRQLGLGPLDTVSLAAARTMARECREQLLRGQDPVEQRRVQRASQTVAQVKAMTFMECANAYISAHAAGWRDSEPQWTSSLANHVHPVIGILPVAEIDTGLVLKVLEPIWTAKPETAGRLRSRIELVLDWARVRGYRTGENPARWKGHLDHLLPAKSKIRAVRHYSAIPYTELPAFMAELRGRDGAAELALEFMILTAARSGMARGAAWSEFDLTTGVWTVPGNRMKGGKEHRVPLSKRAMEILTAARKHSGADLVFPGSDGQMLHRNDLLAVLRRMGRTGATPHGFRSAFKTWATEQTNYQTEAIEIGLAHSVGDKVEQAYMRGELMERRRRLMETWAEFCSSPTAERGTVVQLAKMHG
jgi:integrase